MASASLMTPTEPNNYAVVRLCMFRNAAPDGWCSDFSKGCAHMQKISKNYEPLNDRLFFFLF